MGMEVCTTLGMLNAEQAKMLKEAGLTAYNHNLDTSREVSDLKPLDEYPRNSLKLTFLFSLSPTSHYV